MRLAKREDQIDVTWKLIKKTNPPRTGLSGYEDGTMKLPPDENDAGALASRAFGYDDPRNAEAGVTGLMRS